MTGGCRPVITPEDCGPIVTVPASPVAPPVPADRAASGLIAPESPPVGHLGVDLGAVGDCVAPTLTFALAVVAVFVALVLCATLRGWEPRRVRNVAASALTLPATVAVSAWDWTAPITHAAAGASGAYGVVGGAAAVMVTAVPVASLAASVWWARRRQRVETVGLSSLPATLRSRERHLDAQRKTARRAAAGPLPLTVRGEVVLGRVFDVTRDRAPGALRAWLARDPGLITLSRRELHEHLVVVGGSGSGKTTLLLRLLAASYAADWAAYCRTGRGRPLSILVDCKGGKDGRRTGERVAELATGLGVDPRRVAVWPRTDRLDLWAMPPGPLTAVLESLILPPRAANGENEHFRKAGQSVIGLVVDAPCGPPRSSVEFLARCSEGWITENHPRAVHADVTALQMNKPPTISDTRAKARLLFAQIGPAFDGARGLDEFDVIYATVPGTVQEDTAAAQVSALLRMVLEYASGDHGRVITAIVDEYSAIGDAGHKAPVTQIAERGRSMGMRVVVAAQNHLGLGPTPDQRDRLIDGCAALVAMRGKGVGDALERYGTRQVYEASRHLLGGRHGSEGTGSLHDGWLADPQRVRDMMPGELVMLRGTRAEWGATTPLTAGELAALPSTRKTRLDAIPTAVLERGARTARTRPDPAPARPRVVFDLDDLGDGGAR